jgi:SHS2 domain-containing protein
MIHCMHELFEHTADLGLRVRAADLNTLFAEAAECLFSAVLEDVDSVQPRTAITVELSGTDREFLLFDWLRELLMRCDEDHVVFGKFAVQVRDDGLTGTAWGEPLDPTRHLLAHEVKAITYHELKVEQTPDGWLAEVIVDI